MRLLVAVLTAGTLALSCSADQGRASRAEPRRDVHPDATELARWAQCRNPLAEVAVSLEVGEPPPVESVHCNIGDAQLSVRTYGAEGDVQGALAAIDRYCGFRLAGDRWIVVVNTRRTAETLQARLGGRVVTLGGCGPS